MVQGFLGRGWRFPVGVNNRGGIALASGEQDIEESIRIILGTAPGERVMRPGFGSELHTLLFSAHSPTTAGLIDHHVREALGMWEPRIEVEDVKIRSDAQRSGVLLIEILYRLRSTNDARNLVYPFYHMPEEEG
jgi:phage baseplate assembly protein W